MKKITLLFTIILITVLLTGCSESKTTPVWINKQLQSMSEINAVLIFHPNPMYEYSVVVDQQLLTIMDIDHWKESNTTTIQSNTAIMMLYCDLQDENNTKNCRIVFFSDGLIMIQAYENNKLLSDSSKWYYNTVFGERLFYNLANWIDLQTTAADASAN